MNSLLRILSIFIVSLYITVNYSYGQITITSDDFPTDIGTLWTNYQGWSAINFDVMSTGPDHTWDFSQADTLPGMFLTEEVIDPNISPILNTNLLMMTAYEFPPGFVNYIKKHCNISTSSLLFMAFELYNNYSTDSTIISTAPGIEFFKFPMTYQTAWEGTYLQETINNGVVNDTITVHYDMVVDGWGQIITPYNTFDCIRLFTIWSHWNDTIQNWYDFDTTFTWLSNEIPLVFQMDEYETDPVSGQVFGQFKIFQSSNVGIDDQLISDDEELFITPNPVINNAMIHYFVPKDGPGQLSIYDIQGRKIETLFNKDLSTGRYELEYSTEGLSNGIYLCVLKTGVSAHVCKLVKE